MYVSARVVATIADVDERVDSLSIQLIRRGCELGVDVVDAKDNHGNTVLHFLATKATKSCPKFLQVVLDSGATVDIRNAKGHTSLYVAAAHRKGQRVCSAAQYECIHALIAAGADVSVLQ